MDDPTDAPAVITARRPRNRSQRQIEDSAELKASIVDAATAIFAERGYTQTTLDMVARTVGLTRPGVLHHFSSKEALFQAVLARQHEWAGARIGHSGTASGLAGILELRNLVGTSTQSRMQLRLIHVLEGESIAGNTAASEYVHQRSRYVWQYIHDRLAEAQSRAEVDPAQDVETLTTLVAATVNGLQKAWLIDPERDTGRAFDALLELLTAGASVR